MGILEDLLEAREAFDRRQWVAAYDGLSGASPDGLPSDDFVRLATAAYLLGRTNDCVQALQRAYQANLDDGQVAAAAGCALRLATVLFEAGETAVAGGWVSRSQRLLEGLGDVVDKQAG